MVDAGAPRSRTQLFGVQQVLRVFERQRSLLRLVRPTEKVPRWIFNSHTVGGLLSLASYPLCSHGTNTLLTCMNPQKQTNGQERKY